MIRDAHSTLAQILVAQAIDLGHEAILF